MALRRRKNDMSDDDTPAACTLRGWIECLITMAVVGFVAWVCNQSNILP